MEDDRRNGNGRRRLDDLEATQGRMVDLLIGPEKLQMDGTMQRQTEEGMDYKVDWMYEQERNGGLRVRLAGRDRALVWVAFFTALGAVIAAWVGA